jgi:hypothetical protein
MLRTDRPRLKTPRKPLRDTPFHRVNAIWNSVQEQELVDSVTRDANRLSRRFGRPPLVSSIVKRNTEGG